MQTTMTLPSQHEAAEALASTLRDAYEQARQITLATKAHGDRLREERRTLDVDDPAALEVGQAILASHERVAAWEHALHSLGTVLDRVDGLRRARQS